MNQDHDRTTTLRVTDMDCPDEVALIEKSLTSLTGVSAIEANLMSGKVTIRHTDEIAPSDLISALKESGLKSCAHDAKGRAAIDVRHGFEKFMVTLSGTALFAGLVVKWTGPVPVSVINSIFAVAILAAATLIFPGVIASARRLSPDINILMTIAVAGAILIGEWTEGAVVFFLFSFSELLEVMSVARTRRAIRSLLDLSPPTALVKRGNCLQEIAVEEVSPGEIVLIKSGARIPLDGTMTRGRSAVNEAPITGESMPAEKTPGDSVFAGTVNGTGSFEFEVTHGYRDTTLARIVHRIEEAQEQKSGSQRFVDRFSRHYTPAVIALSAFIFLIPPLLFDGVWTDWFYRALVLLVISCPCALVISTPVSVVSGLTALARQGVLVKGGLFLEHLAKLRAVALDKTGTLTEGRLPSQEPGSGGPR